MSESLMSMKQVAEKLNMSWSSVYRLITSGQLKAYAIGGTQRKTGAYRVSQQQLDEFLSESLYTKTMFAFGGGIRPRPKTQTVMSINEKLNKVFERKNKTKKATDFKKHLNVSVEGKQA